MAVESPPKRGRGRPKKVYPDDVSDLFGEPPPKLKKAINRSPTKKKPKPPPSLKHVPPREYNWKPGQSGNPLGGALHDPPMRALKALTKIEFLEIGNLIVKGNHSEIMKMAVSPHSTMLQKMLASVAERVIVRGDMRALDLILNRLIGKVKEEVHHTGTALMPQVVVTLPSNGREANLVPISVEAEAS